MDSRSSKGMATSEYALPELRDAGRAGSNESKSRRDEHRRHEPQQVTKTKQQQGQAPKNNKEALGSRRLFSANTLLEERWEVGELLSEGGFGQIYRAFDRREHRREVAIKAEANNAHLPLLRIESLVLQSLNRRYPSSPHHHFVSWHSDGSTPYANFIVMDLCGPNLRELKKATSNDQFSVTTSLWLASQMVRALQFLHEAGWLHRDVKPSNFCLGRTPNTRRSVYLIDFGLARAYISSSGEIKKQRAHSGFHGTVRYASLATHRHQDLDRVDDLWSVFYITVENIIAHLPWRLVTDKKQVMQLKETTDLLALKFGAEKVPPASVRSLQDRLMSYNFYSRPNYEAILRDFESDLAARRFTSADLLDWETRSDSTPDIVNPLATACGALDQDELSERRCKPKRPPAGLFPT